MNRHEELYRTVMNNEKVKAYKLKQFYGHCDRTVENCKKIKANCERARQILGGVL